MSTIYAESIMIHSSSIFLMFDYLNNRKAGSGHHMTASFRMVFPLMLIAKRSPDPKQRAYAQIKMEEWTEQNGLSQPMGSTNYHQILKTG
jgi:hypothetical protein